MSTKACCSGGCGFGGRILNPNLPFTGSGPWGIPLVLSLNYQLWLKAAPWTVENHMLRCVWHTRHSAGTQEMAGLAASGSCYHRLDLQRLKSSHIASSRVRTSALQFAAAPGGAGPPHTLLCFPAREAAKSGCPGLSSSDDTIPRDFTVVRTLRSHCQGSRPYLNPAKGSIPGQGTKIPQVCGMEKKKLKRWHDYLSPCIHSPEVSRNRLLFFSLIDASQVTSTAAAKSLQSCPTLGHPIDGSPPGSPIPGIFQARTLEWVAISFSTAWKWKVKVKSLSRVRLLATPWTAAYQAPPSMGFSRQEYWSGVPLPSPN